jgi:hypothetical protein
LSSDSGEEYVPEGGEEEVVEGAEPEEEEVEDVEEDERGTGRTGRIRRSTTKKYKGETVSIQKQ